MAQETGELPPSPLTAVGDSKSGVRSISQNLKSNAILLWEAATSIYQAYTIIASGAFEDAWFAIVQEPFNVTLNGTIVNVTTIPTRKLDFELHAFPRYPETALINVTIYTLALALLLLFSLLYGLSIIRRVYTSVVLVLLSLSAVVNMLTAFISLALEFPAFVSVVMFFLIVLLLGIIVGVMGYCAYKAHKSSPSHRRMLRVEYVAIVLFYQVFDLIKDTFFLVTSTDDPLFFLLTIFDMQLSWLMIVELYAEPGFDLSLTSYIKSIIQCTIQATALIFLPSIIVGVVTIYVAMFFQLRKPKKSTPEKKVRCEGPPCCREGSCCGPGLCCGLTNPGIRAVSVLVDKERGRVAAAALVDGDDDMHIDDAGPPIPAVEPGRERLKSRAKQVKTVSVLLWESATTFYQVYSLFVTGSFEKAYYGLGVNNNQTVSEVDLDLWLLPKYPETVLINVTVYSLAVSSLVVLSTLHVCNLVVPIQATIVIISLCVAVITVFPVLPFVTLLETSSVAIGLFSVGGLLAIAWLGYLGVKIAHASKQFVETVEMQHVSSIVFFQVYDMMKDIFFIVVAPDDPFVLLLTVFDIVLSLLMIVEFYADPKYELDTWKFTSCVLHYTIVAIAVILLPGLYIFCAFVILTLVMVWINKPKRIEGHANEYPFYCTKTKHMQIALFSILVSTEFDRAVIP